MYRAASPVFTAYAVIAMVLFSCVYALSAHTVVRDIREQIIFTQSELSGLNRYETLTNKNAKPSAMLAWQIQDIADTSNLILDPELTSYHLVNLLVNILPSPQRDQTQLERSVAIVQRSHPDFSLALGDALRPTAIRLLRQSLQARLEALDNRYTLAITVFVATYVLLLCFVLLSVRNTAIEAELQKARAKAGLLEQLKHANAELENFAHLAAHDLKEPVRTIASFAAIIRKSGRDDNNYLALIEEAAKRMEKMITVLLEYAQKGGRWRQDETVDCHEQLTLVLKDIAPLLTKSGAEVTCDTLPVIKGDVTGFRRIMQNLIRNAVLHAKPDTPPKIRISAVKKVGYWRFAITDNGMGIPQDKRETVFRPFERGAENNNPAGSGLGLPICRKLVELAGGEIWITDAENGGSIFYFTLPYS